MRRDRLGEHGAGVAEVAPAVDIAVAVDELQYGPAAGTPMR